MFKIVVIYGDDFYRIPQSQGVLLRVHPNDLAYSSFFVVFSQWLVSVNFTHTIHFTGFGARTCESQYDPDNYG